jgi:hypothetical protein
MRPTVLTAPVLSSSMKFKLGVTTVLVSAEDSSGNVAKCSFNVTVVDKQKPTIDFCMSPPKFIADQVNLPY